MAIETRTFPRRWAGRAWLFPIIAWTGISVSACEGLVDVENPNNIVQEDLERPAAAAAIVNGALTATSRAIGYVGRAHSTVTDELVWRGSFDYVGQMDRGELWNNDSDFVVTAFANLSVARWLSEEGIKLLEGFEGEGTLSNRNLLGTIYLLSGINHATAADMFEDFAMSDRQEAAPPVGRNNMHTLYGVALERLARAEAIARETGNAELELASVAWRARVNWARAAWEKLAPKQTPADPLISSAQAEDLARVALSQASADWQYQFLYNSASAQNWFAHWVNSRLEMTYDASLVRQDGSGRRACSPHNPACPEDGIVLLDPIDQIQDPALRRNLWSMIEGHLFSPMTGVSARELRLILAEGALARGNMTEFAEQVNAVRSLEDGLSPYDPSLHSDINPVELLEHMRRTNLAFQVQRRLVDMYRFGIRSPRWIDSGESVQAPGTVLPISGVEMRSNCHIVGSC